MFRFTIRDVLWLTLVVAVLVGAFVNHLRLSAKLAASEDARAGAANDAALLALFSDKPSRGDLAKLRAKYGTRLPPEPAADADSDPEPGPLNRP